MNSFIVGVFILAVVLYLELWKQMLIDCKTAIVWFIENKRVSIRCRFSPLTESMMMSRRLSTVAFRIPVGIRVCGERALSIMAVAVSPRHKFNKQVRPFNYLLPRQLRQ